MRSTEAALFQCSLENSGYTSRPTGRLSRIDSAIAVTQASVAPVGTNVCSPHPGTAAAAPACAAYGAPIRPGGKVIEAVKVKALTPLLTVGSTYATCRPEVSAPEKLMVKAKVFAPVT